MLRWLIHSFLATLNTVGAYEMSQCLYLLERVCIQFATALVSLLLSILILSISKDEKIKIKHCLNNLWKKSRTLFTNRYNVYLGECNNNNSNACVLIFNLTKFIVKGTRFNHNKIVFSLCVKTAKMSNLLQRDTSLSLRT